jgi:predicted RNase H-like HicB family nuclease
MQLTVLIEPIASNGFRARSGEPLALTAEGATREEALQKLQEQIAAKVASGAELTSVEAGPSVHPWAPFAGTWREDDPIIAAWQKEVEEYRRRMDEDPDIP